MSKSGPIEDGTWPQQLRTCVVAPGFPPRIHGYDVQGDLARHYDFAEVVLTAALGHAPDPAVGHAFNVALVFLAPVRPGAGPSHGAGLARMLALPGANVVTIAAMGLADQAEEEIRRHDAWLTWLVKQIEPVPQEFISADPGELATVAALCRALGPHVELCPVLQRFTLTRQAAIFALLHACGLTSPLQLLSALVVARLGTVIAEAQGHGRGQLRHYPLRVPDFAYEDPRDE